MFVSSGQHDLPTQELDYELPEHLIATRPAEPRDSARMLVARRSGGEVEHRLVRDLPDYLRAGDALVFNTAAVAPARLIGRRAKSGGRVEGLFLRELPHGPSATAALIWQVMLKAGGRLHIGDRIELLDRDDHEAACALELIEHSEAGDWIVAVTGADSTMTALQQVGRTPLPPYILKARGEDTVDDQSDRRWYQTVYADPAKRQSVAAPTAGLHFTPELLERLVNEGVRRIDVTLHVGAGTFKPITATTLSQHRMHTESFEASGDSIREIARMQKLRGAKPQAGGGAGGYRLIAVGTTSVRVLESLPSARILGKPESVETGQMCGRIAGLTDLMIAPRYEFKYVDGMLTNFHLPRSTLLALVAAMLGLDRLKAIYREAIEKGYRFYSYGDAMLILP